MTVRTSRGHGSQPRSFPGQTGRTCNSWRGDWLRLQRRELHAAATDRQRAGHAQRRCAEHVAHLSRRDCGGGAGGLWRPEALPEALALVLHQTPLLRDFSRHCARRPAAEFAKLLRTFGCRHRPIGIGDFSAQCLNGRRQAMIFRLSGVALFPGISSSRTSRAETAGTATPDDCRWPPSAVQRRMS